MPVLKKKSLSDQLYEEIRARIIDLTYPLGSKLNVNELQEVFEVSSTPIREAINRLQVEGLITYESNVGARVLMLEENDVYEIQDLALTLHSAAIRFAMERGDHPKIAEALQKQINGYRAAKTIDSTVKCVFLFIGTFYAHCGNSRLDSNMKVIQGEQLILRYLYQRYVGTEEKPCGNFERMAGYVRQDRTERVIGELESYYRMVTPVMVKALAQLPIG